MAVLGEISTLHRRLIEMPSIHVRLVDKGPWHRLRADAAHMIQGGSPITTGVRTACGKRMGGAYGTRDEGYEWPLCLDGCFSAHELEYAQQLARGAVAVDVDDVDQPDMDREEVRRRLSTGKFPRLVIDDKEEE